MPSFSTPLSGLNANSQELSVIANNLANLNTVGFKTEVTNFQDLFYQQIGTNGAGDPVQVGVGTEISSTSGDFTQGSIEATGVPTDIAIQGNGLLTTVKNGLQEFTRAGSLSVATNGSVETSDGGLVQGYEAVNGVINPNQTLGTISVPAGLTSPPHATTTVELTLNLDSGTSNRAHPGQSADPARGSRPQPFSGRAASWGSPTGRMPFRTPPSRTTRLVTSSRRSTRIRTSQPISRGIPW